MKGLPTTAHNVSKTTERMRQAYNSLWRVFVFSYNESKRLLRQSYCITISAYVTSLLVLGQHDLIWYLRAKKKIQT